MKTKKPFFKIERNNAISTRMMNALDITKPVKVYYNLHKKCVSVQQDGIVKFHTEYIVLRDVEFKVSEAGRQRVLKEKRKNVHAFCKGFISCPSVIDDLDYSLMGEATYNPYKYSTFVNKETEEPIYKSDFIDLLCENSVVMCEELGIEPKENVAINIFERK